MKRIPLILLGLSILFFTGCPPQPEPGAPPKPKGAEQAIPPGVTTPEQADISKEVGEAVKETKEAVAAVAEVAVEKTKEAAEVVVEKSKEAAVVVKETAEKAAEVVAEKTKEAVEVAKETAGKAAEVVSEKAKETVGVAKEDAVKETKEAAPVVEKVEEKAAETATAVKEIAEKAIEKTEKAAEVIVEKVEEKATEAVVAVQEEIDHLLGKAEGKPKEILDILRGYKTKRAFDATKNAARKPKVFANLPKEYPNPDGMTVSDKTGSLFLSVPNFNRRPNDSGPKVHPAVLLKVNMDGSVENVMTFDKVEGIQVPTKQIGPMGIDFGPDGHLYVCDNQYFFDTTNKSRILRVLMDGDKPTGKVEIVVEGIKLSNAIMWLGDNLFLTDTFLDLEGEFGAGCLWKFGKDEILKAGSVVDGAAQPPIKLNPLKKAEDDPHCVAIRTVQKIPGGGNGGMDGLTADSNGVVYTGNFGNGEMYRFVFGEDGKATVDVIHPAGEYFHCCDGIFYDKTSNKVYVTDSASNAVHAFVPPKAGEKAVFETIWENGNTDGADGSLDQPCEPIVIGKKLILANFDWPFPELLNTNSEDPSTLSVIELE